MGRKAKPKDTDAETPDALSDEDMALDAALDKDAAAIEEELALIETIQANHPHRAEIVDWVEDWPDTGHQMSGRRFNAMRLMVADGDNELMDKLLGIIRARGHKVASCDGRYWMRDAFSDTLVAWYSTHNDAGYKNS